MKLIWLGHAGFRIEIEQATILIDPWLSGNPMFPADRRAEATRGVTHIALTHGHGDHSADALQISKETGAPIAGVPELVGPWAAAEGINAIPFNKGGTVEMAGASLSMVPASHSSSLQGPNGLVYTGTEAGFVLRGEGHCLYISGDTSIIADMAWIGEYYRPDIGVLCAGGHYTMDMEGAAWAARKYFDFKTVVPCHYKTFPVLAQSAEALKAGLPGVDVIEPEVLKPIVF